jgi:hypothetical protein
MKITKSVLKQIIKEELQNVLDEQSSVTRYGQKQAMPGDDLKFKIDPRLNVAGVPAQVDDSPRMQRRRRRERTPAQHSINALDQRSSGLDDFFRKVAVHGQVATAKASGNFLFLVPANRNPFAYRDILKAGMPVLVTDGQAKETKTEYIRLNQSHAMNAIGLQTPSGKVVAVMLPPG